MIDQDNRHLWFVAAKIQTNKITHIDVLHVSHLTSDGVKLLCGLTDMVTVLQEEHHTAK